jgi:hydrogenase nickel incorporation protein HypA/HybF
VTIPAVTFCGSCGKTYETVKYGKECPYCHSEETWLVDGNQCVIKEIEAECEEDSIEEDTDDDDLDYRAGDFAEDE